MDVVITYVNTNDIAWRNKYELYYDDYDSKRHSDNGEVIFNLKLLQKNLSWIRNIFIVTDDQQFDISFLNKKFRKKIRFIYHKELIPRHILPVFNSMIIEMFLWNIPGLSTNFIYLNDDVFIGRPLHKSDFVTKDNKIIQFTKYLYNNIIISLPWHNVLQNSSNLYYNKFKRRIVLKTNHLSWNLNKDCMRDTYFLFKNDFKRQLLYKRRVYANHTYDFLTLCQIRAYHTKVAINKDLRDGIQSRIISRELVNDDYNFIKTKPMFFVLNFIQKQDKYYWKKIQNYMIGSNKKYYYCCYYILIIVLIMIISYI
jgi:hypothetical protein